MFAMKAARDAMNIGRESPRLLLLCTGSSRSKLGGLVTGKESPFFGSRVLGFPLLGYAFVEYVANRWNERFLWSPKLNAQSLERAFSILWSRPEELINATSKAMFAIKSDENINDVIVESAILSRDEMLADMDHQFTALLSLQQSVLLRMVAEGDTFSPYDINSMEYYQKTSSDKVTVASVQNAIDALVKNEIVWRPKRGGYFIDDPMWNDWVELRYAQVKVSNVPQKRAGARRK